MKRKILLFLFTCLIGGLLGCNKKLPMEDFPSQFILEKYEKSTYLVYKINESDPIYNRLKTLLEENKDGWRVALETYAPGPYVFISPNYSIKCFPDLVVIDINHNGKYMSLKKNIPDVLKKLELSD